MLKFYFNLVQGNLPYLINVFLPHLTNGKEFLCVPKAKLFTAYSKA